MGYTVSRRTGSPSSRGRRRTEVDRLALGGALRVSRERLALPAGAHGRRHRDLGQEEVFVVLGGTLTIDLGEPPERHEVPRGGVVVVERGEILQLRNAGEEELVLFIYGAPPETGKAEFFDPVP